MSKPFIQRFNAKQAAIDFLLHDLCRFDWPELIFNVNTWRHRWNDAIPSNTVLRKIVAALKREHKTCEMRISNLLTQIYFSFAYPLGREILAACPILHVAWQLEKTWLVSRSRAEPESREHYQMAAAYGYHSERLFAVGLATKKSKVLQRTRWDGKVFIYTSEQYCPIPALGAICDRLCALKMIASARTQLQIALSERHTANIGISDRDPYAVLHAQDASTIVVYIWNSNKDFLSELANLPHPDANHDALVKKAVALFSQRLVPRLELQNPRLQNTVFRAKRKRIKRRKTSRMI